MERNCYSYYSHGLVTKGIEKGRKIQVNELRTIRQQELIKPNEDIAFTTYNPKHPYF